MKVLLINGSPRENGNTARALKEVPTPSPPRGSIPKPSGLATSRCEAAAPAMPADKRTSDVEQMGLTVIIR